MAAAETSDSSLTNHSSLAFRAWLVLVAQSFQRHWRVRQMGLVAAGLLGLCVVAVAVITASPAGWGLPERKMRRGFPAFREYAENLLYPNRIVTSSNPGVVPRLFDPVAHGVQSLVLSVPYAALRSKPFVDDWEFLNFSRWVVLGVYLGFVLPLFTLAYASGAIGGERESRSLIWLTTRPIPRSAIYLAKFLGTLPWCLGFSLGGFLLLCLAGGEVGRKAAGAYWPAVVGGTLGFAALFHLVGAVFRRPVVVGLVYIFFFEMLVAALPGSLKRLSLSFYTRSLMYTETVNRGTDADALGVVGPVDGPTAWTVLLAATVGLTLLGMWLFARHEFRDDV